MRRKGQPALVNFGDELLDLAGEIAAFKVSLVVVVVVVWW